MNSEPKDFAAESAVVEILKEYGIELVGTLPCIKIRNLLTIACGEFIEIPLTREEEGVGIACGAFLGGKRMALLIQSGGIGNSINALLSLARFYRIPVPILISWRGGPDEPIEAQRMMGEALPGLLEASSIPFIDVGGDDSPESGAEKVREMLQLAYTGNIPTAILFRPSFWKSGDAECGENREIDTVAPGRETRPPRNPDAPGTSSMRDRFTAIKSIVEALQPRPDALVVSNIGYPSRELYAISDHPRNFYMLGSLGMASSIGLGLSLATERPVYVLDGDGSILMNPNALVTAAACADCGRLKGSLTIICLDNGVHGSTGDQRTYSGRTLELPQLARGAGMENTITANDENALRSALEPEFDAGRNNEGKGKLRFIHVKMGKGNAEVGVIPLNGREIKKRFMEHLGTL